jgi:hypothetical protein
MKKAEIKSVLAKVKKTSDKIRGLHRQIAMLTIDGQKMLDKLAEDTCPYKKDQIFKKRGSAVWVIVRKVGARVIKHGLISESCLKAPFLLECLRCTVKGVPDKQNWVIVFGEDIGVKWDLVEGK